MATLFNTLIQDTYGKLLQIDEGGVIQTGLGETTFTSSLTLTGSIEVSGGITGSFYGTIESASYAQSASYLSNEATASLAISASYSETASAANDFYVGNNLVVAGTASIGYLSTTYENATIIYTSGSTKFGDTADDVMSVTGSIQVSGSITADSLIGTASLANTASLAVTASHALTASYLDVYATASYALTASYLDMYATASHALTASLAVTASNALTASYLDAYATASHALTASNVNTLNQDVFITGSVNLLGNLSVIGTASFILVTASQVLVEQNTITVYGSGSALPKAGYRAVDTASISNSGSFLYDFNNRGWESSAPITASHFVGTASYAASIPTREFTATASATWWLDHNLGTEWVQVTCWDTATKRVIQPDEIEAMSTASVKITWTTPIAGVARIS